MSHVVTRFAFVLALILILRGDPAAAQSGTRRPAFGSSTRSQPLVNPQPQSAASVQPRKSFDAKFWDYLQRSRYRNWAPAPGQTDRHYEGQSPHGAFLKMYLNRKAAGNPRQLPPGSVIVKENYGPDRQTLMAITVMHRSPNFNPAAGDWYWVKYNPDGTVAKSPPDKGSMALAGKVAGCIDCHASSADDDFVFFNDP